MEVKINYENNELGKQYTFEEMSQSEGVYKEARSNSTIRCVTVKFGSIYTTLYLGGNRLEPMCRAGNAANFFVKTDEILEITVKEKPKL